MQDLLGEKIIFLSVMQMVEIKEYVTGFITAIVAFLIAVNVVPLLMSTVGNITGIPLLSSALVGTIVGAGLIMFLLKTFI